MMTIRTFIILLIFTSLWNSCRINNSTETFELPQLKDTLERAEHYYSPLKMTTPKTYIEAIRKFGENIDVNDTISRENYFIDDLDDSDTSYKSLRERDGLRLYVDNSKVVSVNIYKWTFPSFIFDDFPDTNKPKSMHQQLCDSLVYQAQLETWKTNQIVVKGYPVYIVNPTNNTIRVEEQDGRLMIIQEAMDAKGNWKPIECWIFSDCGYSYGGIALKPHSYIFTKIIAYMGEFETTLRLKFLNDTIVYYSEPLKEV